jgi:hypothetical protein
LTDRRPVDGVVVPLKVAFANFGRTPAYIRGAFHVYGKGHSHIPLYLAKVPESLKPLTALIDSKGMLVGLAPIRNGDLDFSMAHSLRESVLVKQDDSMSITIIWTFTRRMLALGSEIRVYFQGFGTGKDFYYLPITFIETEEGDILFDTGGEPVLTPLDKLTFREIHRVNKVL